MNKISLRLCHDCMTEYIPTVYETVKKFLFKSAVGWAVIRFFSLWSIFTGAIVLNSSCPFCGNCGCPIGIGSSGIIAFFLALIKQYGLSSVHSITSFINFRLINKRDLKTIEKDENTTGIINSALLHAISVCKQNVKHSSHHHIHQDEKQILKKLIQAADSNKMKKLTDLKYNGKL